MANDDDFSSTQYVILKGKDEQSETYLVQNLPPSRISQNFKLSSLSAGLLVGFLVQMTTLGANVVIWEMWGVEMARTSRREVVAFSLLWSFITSAIAILTLGFLRAVVSNFFWSLPVEARLVHLKEKVHDRMIESMEILFVIGALVGVSLAWCVTDMLVGMPSQINFSLITLGICLLWCKAVLWFRSRCDEEIEAEYEFDEDTFFLTEQEFLVVQA